MSGNGVSVFEERLAEWEVVCPSEIDGVPNVQAEHLTVLESALQALRETGQPLGEADRRRVLSAAVGLLQTLGRVEVTT